MNTLLWKAPALVEYCCALVEEVPLALTAARGYFWHVLCNAACGLVALPELRAMPGGWEGVPYAGGVGISQEHAGAPIPASLATL